MERITAVFIIFSMNIAIQSLPIENGFSIKFNPISTKEELSPKQFGALFAKIPQDFKPQDELRRDTLTKSYFVPKPDSPLGYSNQVAKLTDPARFIYDPNITHSWDAVNFLNLPIIRQPYDNYKVLVATAPPDMKMDATDKGTIIYVVFPEDGSGDTTLSTIPTIYFVNEKSGKTDPAKKGLVDPILIVDNNRTVTGLKSKEVAKFIRFKNKWNHRYDYKITR